MLPTIPGITVRTGRFLPEPARPDPRSRAAAGASSVNGRFRGEATLGNWLVASIDTRCIAAQAIASDGRGVTVLFDGYLTAVNGTTTALAESAGTVLREFLRHGADAFSRFRGSVTCAVVDERADQCFVFNDRRASRPLFSRVLPDGSALIGPELSTLVVERSGDESLDLAGVCQSLMFGSYYADTTLFAGTRKLPQASLVGISRSRRVASRYWRLNFDDSLHGVPAEELVASAHSRLLAAVERCMSRANEPFLLLSGGVDSRIVLGALLELGYRVPVATYGDGTGDDTSTAKTPAASLGLQISAHEIATDALEEHFEDATLIADCRAETIDAAPLSTLYAALGRQYGTFFNGDECFGWRSSVPDVRTARRTVGLLDLREVSRLADWLRPAARRQARGIIDGILSTLIREPADRDQNATKDRLYYEHPMFNYLNAFTAQRLRYMDQARPLLDEDLMDIVSGLPSGWRDDKRLLRTLLQAKFGHLMEVPLATRDSIPRAEFYLRRLQSFTGFSRYLTEHLITRLDSRLEPYFEVDRMAMVLSRLVEGRPAPPVCLPWPARLPGMWRFARSENRVSSITLLMRLLQINLHLTYLEAVRQPQSRL